VLRSSVGGTTKHTDQQDTDLCFLVKSCPISRHLLAENAPSAASCTVRNWPFLLD